MKPQLLLPLLSLGIATGLHAEEVFFGLPPAKGAKPDLARFAGIIDADLFKDPPVRPADVAANPNAWEGKFLEKFPDDEFLFNFAAYTKHEQDRILMLNSKQRATSRAKVLTCITEMFRLLGPPAKYLTDDPEDDTYQDYLGFIWTGEDVQVLLAFRTGEQFPWDGILIASGAKVKPELPVKSEANGAKEIPRPADLKGTLTTWLKKIETE
jgi:hypothetical protein